VGNTPPAGALRLWDDQQGQRAREPSYSPKITVIGVINPGQQRYGTVTPGLSVALLSGSTPHDHGDLQAGVEDGAVRSDLP
jgi:hypothetical protein